MTPLPTILKHEPFLEAVCEVRVNQPTPLGDILPGILYSKLNPKPSLQRLQAAEIPQPIRAQDPALHYAPTQCLQVDEYMIAVGDRNVIISCKRPYPKWPGFKKKILEMINLINEAGVAGKVERFSIKYINLIEAPTPAEQIAKINFSLSVGDLEAKDDHIDVKMHYVESDVRHIMRILSGAAIVPFNKSSEAKLNGIVVEVDSIRTIDGVSFNKFAEDLEYELETLHQSTKTRFFNCLKQETIDKMEPSYEPI